MTDLPTRRVGRSGLAVSVLGLGANNLGSRIDVDASRRVVHAALDAGVTLIDTADVYGTSEEVLGEVLGSRRHQVVLATKFGARLRDGSLEPDGGARGSRRYIRLAVERSLRRLRTDWIDLYQLHQPDPLTPIEETLAALDELVHEGKVRYTGCSNLAAWQVADATWAARTAGTERFVSTQAEYSLLERGVEAELVPALTHHEMGLLPYFPLASGLLTGKYRRGAEVPDDSRVAAWGLHEQLTEERFDRIETLTAFAEGRGRTLLDVAIGGLAAQPAVASVIAGATSEAQVLANVTAARWQPTAEDLAELDLLAPTCRPG